MSKDKRSTRQKTLILVQNTEVTNSQVVENELIYLYVEKKINSLALNPCFSVIDSNREKSDYFSQIMHL